jgi:hypothetical protein
MVKPKKAIALSAADGPGRAAPGFAYRAIKV